MIGMRLTVLGLVVAGITAPALAADHLNVKPGLWSMTTNMQASGAPSMDLSKVPPGQRAAVQGMIAAQMNKLKARAFKSCLTEEDLGKPVALQGENDPSCKVSVKKSTASEVQYSEECTGKNPRTVSADFKAVNDQSVAGKTHVVTHGMTVDMTINGKWINADCGSVKPGHAQVQ